MYLFVRKSYFSCLIKVLTISRTRSKLGNRCPLRENKLADEFTDCDKLLEADFFEWYGRLLLVDPSREFEEKVLFILGLQEA
jgi:hypothetical protein